MEAKQQSCMRGFEKIMDTKMFVLSSENCRIPKGESYQLLLTGAAKRTESKLLGDDTKDHISEKNPCFCELTGMYWIWKNSSCGIVGLCYPDRYFSKEGKVLSKEYIENILENYDIVIAPTSHLPSGTVRDMMEKMYPKEDLEAARAVIGEKYPSFLRAFDWVMDGEQYSFFNMAIMKKEHYDAFCEWLFDILFALEEKIDLDARDEKQRRIFAVLGGHLMRVWLMMQEVFVYEENLTILTKETGIPKGFFD